MTSKSASNGNADLATGNELDIESVRAQFSSDQFVQSLKERDPLAVEKVVRAYSEHLLRAALGMGFNDQEAHELAQNTWASFFEKLPTFEGRSHIRTYLFGFLYNKAMELKRELGKSQKNDPFEEVMANQFDETGHYSPVPVQPDKFLQAIQTIEIIESCMDALPVQQKMAFYMREVERSSTDEICNILKVSTTHLGVILFRARNKLRRCIDGHARGEQVSSLASKGVNPA